MKIPWSPWHARDGWRMNLSAARSISFRDGDALIEAGVRYQGDRWEITLNGQSTVARGKKLDGDRFAVELDDHVAGLHRLPEADLQRAHAARHLG